MNTVKPTAEETAAEIARVGKMLDVLRALPPCRCKENGAKLCHCNRRARMRRVPLLEARLVELFTGRLRWVK